MQYISENDEDKILIAKILDKQDFCLSRNRVVHSDFLNQREKKLIEKSLNLKNCFFYGVCNNADRQILVFYPDKLNQELAKKSLLSDLAVIRIELPNDLKGQYEHKNYLSGLMKIGIAREKIGDILVYQDGADFVIFSANKNYIIQSLQELSRFRKSRIYEIDLGDIRVKEEKFIESTIIVSSMRIDNIVAELAKCSRSKSEELIESERVYINYELVVKGSRIVNSGDIVNIRGKGKFIIDGLVRNTKNDRNVIEVRKFA